MERLFCGLVLATLLLPMIAIASFANAGRPETEPPLGDCCVCNRDHAKSEWPRDRLLRQRVDML
jgi:hypothetical protein